MSRGVSGGGEEITITKVRQVNGRPTHLRNASDLSANSELMKGLKEETSETRGQLTTTHKERKSNLITSNNASTTFRTPKRSAYENHQS